MKKFTYFPSVIIGAILLGGTGGHVMRRSEAAPAVAAATASSQQSSSPSHRSTPPLAAQSETGFLHLRPWLEEALQFATDPGGDMAMDAPHLWLSMMRWHPNDIKQLLAELQPESQSPVRRRLEEWILKIWTERAPQDAMEWTKVNRPDQYPAAIENLARRDGRAAWKAVEAHPWYGRPVNDTIQDIFSEWAQQDCIAALEEILQLRSGHQHSFHAALGFTASCLPDKTKDPAVWEAALAALTQRAMQETDGSLRFKAVDLVKNALENANKVTTTLASERLEKINLWLRSLSLDKKELAYHLTNVAQHEGLTPESAPAAWPWLWQKIPPDQRQETLKSIVEYWASDSGWSAKDPNACGQWLNEQMPLGPEHAEALKDFARHAASTDPASGLAWARSNPDPATRDISMREVEALILKNWPHRAAELGVPVP